MQSIPNDLIEYVLQVERFYASLVRRSAVDRNPPGNEEPNLGGKLLYIGECDAQSRAMVVAGNVAGVATLAATGDIQAQRQAIREGAVDFLVTSLDEALRILKNEIRKRQRVAVCVGASPTAIELEMRERGVQPDLLRAQLEESAAVATEQLTTTLAWRADTAPAHWLPLLDDMAIACLDASQAAERRWLRNAPRHLGRTAFGVRLLTADEAFADRFAQRVESAVKSGEIATAVTLLRKAGGAIEEQCFTPDR